MSHQKTNYNLTEEAGPKDSRAGIFVLTQHILCSTIGKGRLVLKMPGNANWSTRLDPTLKMQAEEVLSGVGLTMSGVFTMLLKQIVREQSVPLSLSLDSSNAVYADLLEAQADRANGYQGRNARDVLRDMEQAIAEVEARG